MLWIDFAKWMQDRCSPSLLFHFYYSRLPITSLASPTNPTDSLPKFSVWKWGISAVLLFHFGSLCLAYSANYNRSTVQDNVLVALQPYLLVLNFYPETLPVQLIAQDDPPSSTSVAVANSVDGDWTTVLGSKTTGVSAPSLHSLTSRRLLNLLTALSQNEDEDGILRILKGIASKLEAIDFHVGDRKEPFDLIRLELPGSPNEEGTMEPVWVEAAVARFENGEIGLVPKVDPHRTVRSKLNPAIQP